MSKVFPKKPVMLTDEQIKALIDVARDSGSTENERAHLREAIYELQNAQRRQS